MGKRRMQTTPQTLTNAPDGNAPTIAPDAPPVTYTSEQLAAMLAILSQQKEQQPLAVVVAAPEEKPLTEEQLSLTEAIPSRPCLEEGFGDRPRYTESNPCPSHEKRCRNYINPRYNEQMDPGSDRWDGYAYFKAQPQVDVFVHPDPESPDLEVDSMSINGFALPYYLGKRNKMPRDFVELLKGRNHRFDVYERHLVSEDENREGSLSLTVGGGKAKPFVRRVVD